MGRFVRAVLPFVLAVAAASADEDLRREVDRYLAHAPPADPAPGEIGRLCAAAEEERERPWTFTVAVYLWATAVKGDIDADGNTAPIDLPFAEVFDDLEGAFMGRFGARKGKWGILGDVIWCRLADSSNGSLGGIRGELDLFLAELTGSYRIVDRGEPEKGFTLDGYAGARVYAADVTVTTTLVSAETDKTWVDPIVGFDARYRTGRWLFDLRADIGGFEISSELAWSVTAGVAYRCSKVVWLAAGYRVLDIDFESGGNPLLDLQLSGPFFALVFSW